MQTQPDNQLLTDTLRWSYHHGFIGHTLGLMQDLAKTHEQIMDALRVLVDSGYMKWIANDSTVMTDRGMLETERLGQVDADLMSLRHRAVQAWNAEVQAVRGGSDEALRFWSEELQRDKELQDVFVRLKTALTGP